MALPTQKTSKRRQRQRRSHHALKKVTVRFDEDGNPHLPHRATRATGKYRGKTLKKNA